MCREALSHLLYQCQRLAFLALLQVEIGQSLPIPVVVRPILHGLLQCFCALRCLSQHEVVLRELVIGGCRGRVYGQAMLQHQVGAGIVLPQLAVHRLHIVVVEAPLVCLTQHGLCLQWQHRQQSQNDI